MAVEARVHLDHQDQRGLKVRRESKAFRESKDRPERRVHQAHLVKDYSSFIRVMAIRTVSFW